MLRSTFSPSNIKASKIIVTSVFGCFAMENGRAARMNTVYGSRVSWKFWRRIRQQKQHMDVETQSHL